MHDPNFEKTVQQKMEELQFHPAESVWVNIEKAVAGQRRRRGLPYFWRFALPVLLAAAVTGGYYFSTSRIDRAAAGLNTAAATANAATDGAKTATDRANTASPEAKASVATPAGTSALISRASASADSRRGALTASLRRPDHGSHKGSIKTDFYQAKTVSAAKAGIKGDEPDVQDNANRETRETILTVLEPHGSRKASFYDPKLADQRQSNAIRAAQLNNKKAAIAIAGLQKKVRPWEAGFVAGGGISRLNRLNSAQAAAALSYTAASFYRINGSSQGNAYISDVRSNAAFSGGVYLQKAITDRWTFNTGMTLHYYSSGITIGQQVNTYVQASASFLNPSALATVPSAAVYSAGNRQSFTNKYYFLELPLNMQWQVNKSHLLPLFLEGGFSLARLMSANALLYDSETGVYSKQGNQINKTQLYVSTALMAGLPLHGLHIEVGPQVQYGLTPIVDGHSLGDQHFFYAGIKLVVIPGKK
jgi:Outer membrane protein beta-barrel domain